MGLSETLSRAQVRAQQFMAEVLPKFKKLPRHLVTQADGWLNEETAKQTASHGANCIVGEGTDGQVINKVLA